MVYHAKGLGSRAIAVLGSVLLLFIRMTRIPKDKLAIATADCCFKGNVTSCNMKTFRIGFEFTEIFERLSCSIISKESRRIWRCGRQSSDASTPDDWILRGWKWGPWRGTDPQGVKNE